MMNLFGKKESPQAPFPGIRTARTGRDAIRLWKSAESPSLARLVGIAMTGARASERLDGEALLNGYGALREAASRHIPFVVHLELGASSRGGLSALPALDEAGCFLMHAHSAQAAADFSLIAHRIAERALVPGVVIQDAPETTHTLTSILLPEEELAKEFMGSENDIIAAPTPAQKLLFGGRRRRIPELWTVDEPLNTASAYGDDSLGESRAGGRLFFLDHVADIADEAMRRFAELTGRSYQRVQPQVDDDAEYAILCAGSVTGTAEAVAADLDQGRGGVDVVRLTMPRPFPAEELRRRLGERKGVLVLENRDTALAEDPPLTRETRAALGASGPDFFTAIHGLGGRTPRPAELTAAVKNMLPDGEHRRCVYLSLSRPEPGSPKHEIERQAVLDAYPEIDNAFPAKNGGGAELLPADAFTLRLHGGARSKNRSVGERLGADLAALLDRRVRAHEEPERDAYRITVSQEDIRTAAPPDKANAAVVLESSRLGDILDSVRKGGCVILQSTSNQPEHVREEIPPRALRAAHDGKISFFAADIRSLAGEDPNDLARVLLGCTVAAMKILEAAAPPEKNLKEALRDTLVKRGHNALIKVKAEAPGAAPAADGARPADIPARLKSRPAGGVPTADIQRFHARTGRAYASSRRADLLDPFLASGSTPAATGILLDRSAGRRVHPRFISDKCTGCGDCWLACPDAALPARVNDLAEICDTAVALLEGEGHTIEHLPKALRQVHNEFAELVGDLPAGRPFPELLRRAIDRTTTASKLAGAAREGLEREMSLFWEKLRDFPLALTEPFYGKGSGGLLSIMVDSDACRGCMACVEACGDDALAETTQTDTTESALRRNFAFAQALPDTDQRHILDIDAEDHPAGVETLLLPRQAYGATVGGGGGAPGAGERIVLRLFAATAAAALRQRLGRREKSLKTLIEKFEMHIRQGLSVDIQDPSALADILKDPDGGAITLAEISARLDRENKPLDKEWLKRVTGTLEALKTWRERIRAGAGRPDRADLGAVLAGEEDLVRYPYNPFAFPCAQIGKAGSLELAVGIFDGHMRKMAEGIKAVRVAELELMDRYKSKLHDAFFENFDWRSFTADEMRLCPPIVIVGAARDIFGAALPGLSAALSAGYPLKTLALAAPDDPPENALIAAAHPNVYVLQSGLGDKDHLLRGFVAGLSAPRPAVFHIFAGDANGPESGAVGRARLARDARALPFLRFDPDKGAGFDERLDLAGNPESEKDWPLRPVQYIDEEGQPVTIRLPFTFADYAAAEPVFRDEFTVIPRREWSEEMAAVSDYLEMDEDERAAAVPFVYSADWSGAQQRLKVSPEMTARTERRLAFWRALKRLKRMDIASVDEDAIAEKTRGEMVDKMTESLTQLAAGGGEGLAAELLEKSAIEENSFAAHSAREAGGK